MEINYDKIRMDPHFDFNGMFDEHGYYCLPDGGFFDTDGYYFNPEGFDEFGGFYDESGNYIIADQDEDPQASDEQFPPPPPLCTLKYFLLSGIPTEKLSEFQKELKALDISWSSFTPIGSDLQLSFDQENSVKLFKVKEKLGFGTTIQVKVSNFPFEGSKNSSSSLKVPLKEEPEPPPSTKEMENLLKVIRRHPKFVGGEFDEYGFFHQTDNSFFDIEGIYFNEKGFDELGGCYDKYGVYLGPGFVKEDFDEMEEQIYENDLEEQKVFQKSDFLEAAEPTSGFKVVLRGLPSNILTDHLQSALEERKIFCQKIDLIKDEAGRVTMAVLILEDEESAFNLLQAEKQEILGRNLSIEFSDLLPETALPPTLTYTDSSTLTICSALPSLSLPNLKTGSANFDSDKKAIIQKNTESGNESYSIPAKKRDNFHQKS